MAAPLQQSFLKMDDIFVCLADAGSMGFLDYRVIFTVLLIYIWVGWKFEVGNAITGILKFKINEEEPKSFNFIHNLPYLEECIRLAELRVSELIAAIQSYEKKALAIITGALALIVFVTSKQWCDESSESLGVGIIVSSILAIIMAIFAAGFILTKVVLSGSVPNTTVNYYLQDIQGITEIRESGYSKEEMEEVERCYLYLYMLSQYESAINITAQVVDMKSNQFTVAVYLVSISFSCTILWLGLKLPSFLS